MFQGRRVHHPMPGFTPDVRAHRLSSQVRHLMPGLPPDARLNLVLRLTPRGQAPPDAWASAYGGADQRVAGSRASAYGGADQTGRVAELGQGAAVMAFAWWCCADAAQAASGELALSLFLRCDEPQAASAEAQVLPSRLPTVYF